MPHAGSYPEELLIRANRTFQICKAFSDEDRAKRNTKINENREFKPIKVGSRIYIKRMIRRNKFEPKFAGPLRCTDVLGSTVFCYELATGKTRQVSMDRCRMAEDIFEQDNPNIGQAYPKEEIEDEEEDNQQCTDNLVTDSRDHVAREEVDGQ